MMYGFGSEVGFGLDGWLGMTGMVLMVAGVILLIAWLVGRIAPAPQQPPMTQPKPPAAQAAGQDAVELLRMRFARGEITEDEYRSVKQVLEEGR